MGEDPRALRCKFVRADLLEPVEIVPCRQNVSKARTALKATANAYRWDPVKAQVIAKTPRTPGWHPPVWEPSSVTVSSVKRGAVPLAVPLPVADPPPVAVPNFFGKPVVAAVAAQPEFHHSTLSKQKNEGKL